MPHQTNQQVLEDNTNKRLKHELTKLKNKFKMGNELKVKWLSNYNSRKSGEVIGKTIFIYEEDEVKALGTLRHEFIDYILTKELVSLPQKMINLLIKLFEEEMYERKEKLIEKLMKVI